MTANQSERLSDLVRLLIAVRGEEPEKPFTGKLMLRIPPDIHRKAYIAAKQSGASLNAWITQTLKNTTEHVS
ncbi:MAG TPA: hypothetical protein DCG53_09680 [Syntrophus sp. (in: bacteria)]|nr:hypothetical protein [Syntrophus sp. (in: bacteria)]